MGWVARYTSPDGGANVQLVTRDAKAPEDSVISVHTRRRRRCLRRSSGTRLRDRASDDHRAVGRAPVLRPGTGRQRHQHREASRLMTRNDGEQRSVSRREVLKFAGSAPVLLSLGTVAATLGAPKASAARHRLIDFTERLVPPDQIKSAGYRRGTRLRVRVAARARTSISSPSPASMRMRYARRVFTSSAAISTASPVGRRRRTTPAGTTAAWQTLRQLCGCTPRPGVPDSAPIFFSVDEDIDLDTWKSRCCRMVSRNQLGTGRAPHRHLWPSPGVCVGDRRRRDRALNHSRALVGMADEGVVSW